MELNEENVQPQKDVKPAAADPVDIEKITREAREKEMQRIQEIIAMGEQFNMKQEAANAVKDSKVTVDQFRQQVLDKIANKQHIDTQQANLGMPEKEIQNYSIMRGIQAILKKKPELAGLEMEASAEISKRFKEEPRGFFVPHDVLLREINGKSAKREITTSSGGTGLIATDSLAGSFIDLLRNRALLAQLGMRILSGLVGNVSIPKQSGAATAYWVAESGDSTPSDSAFIALTLALKTVVGATLYSRAMLLQSNPSIDGLVMDDLATELALAIDLAGIAGTGLSNQPTGIIETDGVGNVVAASIDWAKVVELETDVLSANAGIGSMAYLTNAAVNGLLKTREKATNTAQFLAMNGQMNGYPVAVSNQVPSATMIFGVFSQLILGLWGGLDIWPDQYTNAADGGVYIRAFQSCDIGVRQATAFSYADDID